MASRLGLQVVVLAVAVVGCAAPETNDLTRDVEAARAYAASVPFTLGAQPLVDGADDPLIRYQDVPGYAGHRLHARTLGGPYEVVLLSTEAQLNAAAAERLRAEACAAPTVCEPGLTFATVPFSLRDLRSVMGWLGRSPAAASVVMRTVIEPDAASWKTFVELEAEASWAPVVREMLVTAGVPAATATVKVGRPYTN